MSEWHHNWQPGYLYRCIHHHGTWIAPGDLVLLLNEGGDGRYEVYHFRLGQKALVLHHDAVWHFKLEAKL